MTKITVVIENSVTMPFLPGVKDGVAGEHGLCILIERDEKRWLYDTGRGKVIMGNLAAVGIEPDSLDGVIISHGHLDHISGLLQLLKTRTIPLKVYASKKVFVRRFGKVGETMRPVGARSTEEELVAAGAVFEFVEEPFEFAPGLWLSGGIPRLNDFEKIMEPFFVEGKDGLEPDLISDEQGLAIEADEGILVLTGCAHAGIVNTVEQFKKILPGRKIWGIMGGLHILNAGEERLTRTIDFLKAEDVKFIAVGHCTGFRESAAIAAAFPKEFKNMNAGMSFEI